MSDQRPLLRVVDGLTLPEKYRRVLRPGELMYDRHDRARRLPRWFYEVGSWSAAQETKLTPHFALWEFLDVDVREAEPLRRGFPRYLPCAVTLLAAALELFRQEVDTYVHVAANGGYRSPAHRLNHHATPHCWGTAVNVYRIGDTFLDSQDEIEHYNRLAKRLLPAFAVRPFGYTRGHVDDHVHLDVGFTTLVPREAEGEDAEDEGEPHDAPHPAAAEAEQATEPA